MLIVAACFCTAIYMITNSYNEWQTSPVSTTITTHPITELKFPAVTVCPPKGTNTALNYALRNIKTDSLTGNERQKLKRMAKEVFMENPSKRQARQMKRELSVENMRSILDDEMSFPQIDENNQVTLKFQEEQGSFKTPGFGDPKYEGDFYNIIHSFNLILEVQSDVHKDADTVISVQTDGNWSYMIKETGYQVYDRNLSMPDAEKFCISQGGHLASVTSKEENFEIWNTDWRHSGCVWLGAKRLGITDKMFWLDKREWKYTNWVQYFTYSEPTNKLGENCVRFCQGSGSGGYKGTWYDDPCDLPLLPLCLIPPTAHSEKLPTAASGNDTLLMRKQSVSTRSTFQFLWSHESNTDKFSGSSPGFQLTWWPQNRTNTAISASPSSGILDKQNQDLFSGNDDWKPKNTKWGMVNLAQTSRLQNKTDLLRNEVLNQRWSVEILKEKPCLDDKKAEFVINQTMERMIMDYKKHPDISDEDIELGVELYSYLHYCEKKMVEAAKLSVFFVKLLTDHSLETLVASTLNNIQPRVGDKLDDLTAMNMWFEYLDKKLNFSLGPLLVGLSSTSKLKKLQELDPPFLREYANFTTECLQEDHCEDILQVTGKIATKKET